MYGSDPFGSIPYAASSLAAEDLFDVDAMLSDSRAHLVYTVVLNVRNIAGDVTETLHFASRQYVTEPTDYPAEQEFEDRFLKFSFRRSILGETIGAFSTGDGSIVLGNADGEYDDIINTYAVDGQEVVVRVGRVDDPFPDHLVIFKGQATDWFADEGALTITVRDYGYRLNVPAQPNVYAGSGEIEGGADLTGKRKPKAWGLAYGHPMVLVNASALIYQLRDNSDGVQVPIVYDRGVSLSASEASFASYAALAGASVSAGRIADCPSLGLIRFGTTPAGLVFATVLYTFKTTGEVVRELLDAATDLLVSEYDQASFDALAVDQANRRVQFYLGPEDNLTAADATARLMAGVGGWGGFSRDGRFRVKVFAEPAGNPIAYFRRDEGDIIDLNRERLPSGVWPPPYRWRVAYQRNWTVFSDFAGSVTAADRAFYAEPYRLSVAEDTGILADHPLARDMPPVESYYESNGDSAALAARLLALYSSDYQVVRFTTGRRGLARDIGDEINVTHPRFGLGAGRDMIVVEIAENIDVSEGAGVETVEIAAFG